MTYATLSLLCYLTAKDWKQAKYPYIGNWYGKTQDILLGRTNKCRSVCLECYLLTWGWKQ